MSKDGFTPVAENESFENAENTTVMVVNKNDIATEELMNELKNPSSSFFCTIQDDGTRASKIAIYNAISTEGEQLSDHLKEVLEIVNVAAHPVRLTDPNTGEITNAMRTVLIGKDGKCYQAVSEGVVSSLNRIFAIVGSAPWTDEPLKIRPVQVTTSNKFKVTTLELVL